MPSNTDPTRLIIVSNRLPIVISTENDTVNVQPSAGGLVTAMEPILSKTAGTWVGWFGLAGEPPGVLDAVDQFAATAGFNLAPIILSAAEIKGFYQGFSNSIIWPLFHDLQSLCDFNPDYWETYRLIQDRFAGQIATMITPTDVVWIHDYHLIGVGARLKEVGVTNTCAFFLHTPFPSPDIFLKLPWRREMLDELLAYDLIGFQSTRDRRNFVHTYNELYAQSLSVSEPSTSQIRIHQSVVGTFPIAIDFQEFDSQARLPEIVERAEQLRAEAKVENIILSVDRLDYTKGIPSRIVAFARLLRKHPELRKRVTLMQVVVPSRAEVDSYQQLKSTIEQLVSEVNGEFGDVGWTPVRHFFRSITREELLALYLAADIGLVTPLKDGMNLVCKEYCVSHFDGRGRLVLSEFAGAAEEIGSYAALVNPYDIEGVAETLFTVLTEDLEKRRADMVQLRSLLARNDVFAWARAFLEAARVPGAATLLGYEEHETMWSRLWKKILLE